MTKYKYKINYFFRTDIWLTRTEKSAEKPGGFVVRQEKKYEWKLLGLRKKKKKPVFLNLKSVRKFNFLCVQFKLQSQVNKR